MALSEIQNIKTAQDPVLSKGSNITISGSAKQKNNESSFTPSEIEQNKKSKEIKRAAEEKIRRVSELMNDYIQSLKREIKIRVNNETGDIMVKVISEEDGRVIREIPPEELLALAARMEEIAGAFFDQIV